MKTVSVILPCYNEEESLPLFFEKADRIAPQLRDFRLEFVLVNDGSKDKTWEVMNALYQKRDDVTLVNQARNYGQNPAFSAGLRTCQGDFAITMDADGQDPLELIPEICAKFAEGYDVVNPHRASRKEDSFLKRKTAGLFYKFINKIEKRKVIPENVNCFRGYSRRALESLNSLPEKDRYYVGLIPFVGLKTATIDFSRQKREAGKSKYNLDKMLNYAFNIISSSTARPLYLPLKVGAVGSGFFFFSSLMLLVCYLLGQFQVMEAYPQITLWMVISFVFFLGNLILFSIGILGLYLHNVLINARERPDHLIDEIKRPGDKK